MKPVPPLTESDLERIAALLRDGKNGAFIAREINRPRSAVLRQIQLIRRPPLPPRRAPGERRPDLFSPEYRGLVAMYEEEKLSLSEIAPRFGVTRQAIWNALKNRGFRPRGKGGNRK